jgi:predicted methyltransferase
MGGDQDLASVETCIRFLDILYLRRGNVFDKYIYVMGDL